MGCLALKGGQKHVLGRVGFMCVIGRGVGVGRGVGSSRACDVRGLV